VFCQVVGHILYPFSPSNKAKSGAPNLDETYPSDTERVQAQEEFLRFHHRSLVCAVLTTMFQHDRDSYEHGAVLAYLETCQTFLRLLLVPRGAKFEDPLGENTPPSDVRSPTQSHSSASQDQTVAWGSAGCAFEASVAFAIPDLGYGAVPCGAIITSGCDDCCSDNNLVASVMAVANTSRGDASVLIETVDELVSKVRVAAGMACYGESHGTGHGLYPRTYCHSLTHGSSTVLLCSGDGGGRDGDCVWLWSS